MLSLSFISNNSENFRFLSVNNNLENLESSRSLASRNLLPLKISRSGLKTQILSVYQNANKQLSFRHNATTLLNKCLVDVKFRTKNIYEFLISLMTRHAIIQEADLSFSFCMHKSLIQFSI